MQLLHDIVGFFINDAYADTTAAQPQQGGGLSLMLMVTVFIVFMYFTIWRPQSKRAKEQRDLISSLTKGDEVMTAGGILGRVTKVTDQYVVLALTENVDIIVQKSSVVSALPKGTLKSIV